jgi:hypothetical protein
MLLETLGEIEDLVMSPAGWSNALVAYDDDVPAELRNSLPHVLESLREEIVALAGLLAVEPIHRSRSRLVRAMVTSEIVRLDDSYAKKLKGYGPVDPRAKEVIDPHLDRIRAALAKLLATL